MFVGPSVGFLIGWPFGAFVTGVIANQERLGALRSILACVLGGIGVVYLFGVPGIALISNLSLTTAAFATTAFLPGDLTKAILAGLIAASVRRAYPKAL